MNQNLPTRADCIDAIRPCAFTACRHHLASDQSPKGDKSHSCSLDVAEQGERTAAEVAKILGVTQQRVAQIEEKALLKLRKRAQRGEVIDLRSEYSKPKEMQYPDNDVAGAYMAKWYQNQLAAQKVTGNLSRKRAELQNLHSDDSSAHWDK